MSHFNNLWNGSLVSDEDFKKYFYEKRQDYQSWGQGAFSHQLLFDLVEKMGKKLNEKELFYKKLEKELSGVANMGERDVAQVMKSLQEFLKVSNLRYKLKRELGSDFPFELRRILYKENHFEAWHPLGVLVHVTPNNSPLLGVLAVLEGLLSGNVNVLKLARKDSAFASLFFHEMCLMDTTGLLKQYVTIGKISSSDQLFLRDLLSIADVVSAWGSEESLKSLKDLAPKHARFVEWGHKISFGYITKKMSMNNEVLKGLAYEICNNEQMACSSPQCVFLEDSHFDELRIFARALAVHLEEISPQIERVLPNMQESAELTVCSEQVRLDSILGKSELIQSKNSDWRIFIEDSEVLSVSPLFRTIWVKPLSRKNMNSSLRPLKSYLQTVGLAAGKEELEELVQSLFLSGVQRIRSLGEMTDSYIGEPHDGVFALERFCQRISFSDSVSYNLMKNKNSFEMTLQEVFQENVKIMEKEDFQNQKVDEFYSDLYFNSGGSTGDPKLSIFTYDDYHRQMDLAAEGLFAAGLDPKEDRCINLFYAGNLYGGFVSFFTILEKLQAVHFPMGANLDYLKVGQVIIDNRVDTLLGMPSYIIQLFNVNKDVFKKYHGIRKIFYGGEHFSESQRHYFQNEFGVQIIRSASYGSVDAGPLGFQCEFSVGSVHHLHERLHSLEVVEMEKDHPVKKGDIGRLLFTSKVRRGQKIERYAIGDVGRILCDTCECGRKGKRFELLGRVGDVFRIGATFLSYQKFQKILVEQFNFEGSFQVQLLSSGHIGKETVVLSIENKFNKEMTEQDLLSVIINEYSELNDSFTKEALILFIVKLVDRDELIFSANTGKLRSVVDQRI